MNDEWSRCPICFEDYSSAHRPTTFVCGHSTCIDHTVGSKRLGHCPICRHRLRQEDEYHVSYNLEEAARLFQLIKNTIDWSTIKLTSVSNVNDAQNSTLDVIHRDEVYARRLQAELNRGNANEPRRGTQVPSENQALPAQEVTTGLPVLGANQPIGRLKNCSHRCDLVSTTQCCTCSDRRPNHRGARYEGYVDGQGMVYHARRNEHYCSTCKRR